MPAYSQTRSPQSANMWTHSSGLTSPAAWSNRSNAISSNNSRASTFINNVSPSSQTTTEYWLTNLWGFSIPTSATIQGIIVTVEGYDAGSSPSDTYLNISLGKNNNSTYTSFIGMGTSEASFNAGTSTSLWGTTWTPSEINNGAFTVTLRGRQDGNHWGNIYIDYYYVTVYYVAGGDSSTTRDTRIRGQLTSNTTRNLRITGYYPTVDRDVRLRGQAASNRSQDIRLECSVRLDEADVEIWLPGQGSDLTTRNIRMVGKAESPVPTDASVGIKIVGEDVADEAVDIWLGAEGEVSDTSVAIHMQPTGIGSVSVTLNMTAELPSSAERSINLVGRGLEERRWFRFVDRRLGRLIYRVRAEGFEH